MVPVAWKMTRASDLDGMVSETFVVAAEQGHVNRDGDAVFPFRIHQQTKKLAMQVVHGVIIVAQLGGLAWIARLHNVFGGVAQIHSDAAHLGEQAVDFLRYGVSGVAAASTPPSFCAASSPTTMNRPAPPTTSPPTPAATSSPSVCNGHWTAKSVQRRRTLYQGWHRQAQDQSIVSDASTWTVVATRAATTV